MINVSDNLSNFIPIDLGMTLSVKNLLPQGSKFFPVRVHPRFKEQVVANKM